MCTGEQRTVVSEDGYKVKRFKSLRFVKTTESGIVSVTIGKLQDHSVSKCNKENYITVTWGMTEKESTEGWRQTRSWSGEKRRKWSPDEIIDKMFKEISEPRNGRVENKTECVHKHPASNDDFQNRLGHTADKQTEDARGRLAPWFVCVVQALSLIHI